MSMAGMRYTLISAARNEEANIERVIRSVLNQSVLPVKWVIVSDGSTDRTEEIVSGYSAEYGFIELVRLQKAERPAGFASKVGAIGEGCKRLDGFDYELIGNIDADLSFESHYFETLIEKFENPKLGIAGGFIYENYRGHFESRPSNRPYSVAGGIQMFRRECFDAIGGLSPVVVGGEDWLAEINARMKGWEIKAFPELVVFHHKQSRKSSSLLRRALNEGMMDYLLGSHPVFETMKCLGRLNERPFIINSAVRLAAFFFLFLSGRQRAVPEAVVNYLGREQMERVRSRVLGRRRLGRNF